MPISAKHIPEPGQMLCEGCGYILEGLTPDKNCPECGRPVSQSIDPGLRAPSRFELTASPLALLSTSAQILFRPTRFFSHTIAHTDTRAAKVFGLIWLPVISILLSLSIWTHAQWLEGRRWPLSIADPLLAAYRFILALAPLWIAAGLLVLNEIAARLTAWEAAYRGLRLPLPSVRRAMRFHLVHYLPVCLFALLTIWGYSRLRSAGLADATWDMPYLYALSGEVIVFAGYLFFTYWAAMRSILFANK